MKTLTTLTLKRYCKKLYSITIPSSVVTISDKAFYYAKTNSFTFLGNAPDVLLDTYYNNMLALIGISGATLRTTSTATGFDVYPWRAQDGYFSTFETIED